MHKDLMFPEFFYMLKTFFNSSKTSVKKPRPLDISPSLLAPIFSLKFRSR